MHFSAFRSVFRFHVKRAPRKIVSHETYSLSLIFLPIFLHLRRYPPNCMKTDRAAPLQQGGLARVCAVFSPLFSPSFSCTPLKTALILPPESLSSDILLAHHPLPGHIAAPGAHPNAPSCRTHAFTAARGPRLSCARTNAHRPFTPLRFRRILHCFT